MFRSRLSPTPVIKDQVLPLNFPGPLPESVAGGKAARLAALAGGGFPVPPGFVITVAALENFLAANGLSWSMDLIPEALAAALSKGVFPEPLTKAVTEHLDRLGAPFYAVRSSAPGEDSPEASLAGQLLTFLEVPPQEVLEKVKGCWAALFNPRVAAYRQGQGLPPLKALAVLVQVQIRARYAGVAFSLDPRLLSPDQLVVEWVEGPGEALVSGQVSPERLLLRRKAPVLPEGLPPLLADGLKQLVPLLFKAERWFGQPLDVEWAVDDTGLKVLQARPITGLGGDHLVIWSNVNIGENYPQALSPFAWSVVDAFRYGYFAALFRRFGLPEWAIREAGPVIRHLLGVQGGRVYYNLSHWYEMLALFPLSRWFRGFLDHYIGQRVPFAYQPRRGRLQVFQKWRYLPWQAWFWFRLLWNYLTLGPQVAAFEKHFYRRRQLWRRLPLSQAPLLDLEEMLQDIRGFLEQDWGRAALADLAAMVFPGLLELFSRKWHRDSPEALTAQLLRGVSLKSTQGLKLLWRMAQSLAPQEKLRTLLVNKDYETLETALDPQTRDLLENFLEHFGGRCYQELLITSPTFEERRDLLWDIVRSYCLAPHQDPEALEREEAEKRQALVRECLKEFSLGRRLVFRRLLKDALKAVQVREAVRLCQSLIYGEIRRLALELGARLTALGHLRQPEEVFFLTVEEVSQLCQGKFLQPETLPDLLGMRRRAHEAAGDLQPPEFFLLPRGRYFRDYQQVAAAAFSGKVLRGVGISGGRSRGPARVILDPARDGPLQPGEILVARSTDPGWTPLFLVAGGLVLEKGGLLSHGAIVAREFGIPAVAGVEAATRLLPEGGLVLVDGDLGEVRILD